MHGASALKNVTGDDHSASHSSDRDGSSSDGGDVVFDAGSVDAELGPEGEANKVREGQHDEKEIESLALPEDLSSLERIYILVKSDNEVQHIALLTLLPQYMEEVWAATDAVADSDALAAQAQAQAQAEIVSVLQNVLCQLQSLLPSILQKEEWMRNVILDNVRRIIEAARSSESRDILLACSLDLSSQLATRTSYGHASAEDVKVMQAMISILGLILSTAQQKQLRELAKAVCQDIDTEVRAAMALELGHLATADSDWFEQHMLGEFVELLRDEEIDVKTAAVEGLGKVASSVSASRFWEEVMPVFLTQHECLVCHAGDQGWLTTYSKEAQLLRESALALGPALHACESFLKESMQEHDSVLSRALDAFSPCVVSVDITTRCLCAYIMPGLVKTLGPGNYAKYLDAHYQELAADSAVEVRKTVVDSLEPVCVLLGKQRVARYLANMIQTLCRDGDREVRRVLVNAWPTIQDKFVVADPQHRASLLESLFSPCMDLLLPPWIDNVVRTDWRYRVAGLEAFDKLPSDLYDSSRVRQRCVPTFFDLMRNGAEPLRRAAARSLARIVATNPSAQKDAGLLHEIKSH
ncbi:Serine/threonine-protein phosphatase 2A 65 kDa regulatory subunit A beta isoform [Hondaea fermentalgiana]|uniref:Serine/threonine-protein phosphatase 2A 65 kDa regulatory subunit A beta isoform n=1 Tax=Hondaea fermentalgiana TaxID=2315210 RepID=A0A2R5GX98_9STRA|nr:Serine/threonine-protein phosphatase 2A 65 kDa regulatory subunit A beta isoform [Hondaea fermentalgiana]|eukprot:GBG33313.1 Serine/threonine-protein phosphatase 2A 65 kDa regulatory subunit A beta isoform [Hondaea fermentalgiana]